MPRKEHSLDDEYHCAGLQEIRAHVEDLVTWQKRQNGSLERVENTVNDIRNNLLVDAKLAGRVSKLTLVVVGLLVLDLVVHVGPEIAGKLVRAILGLP